VNVEKEMGDGLQVLLCAGRRVEGRHKLWSASESQKRQRRVEREPTT